MTTAYFCFAVNGGTCPAFSSVRKFGNVKKSRSFDVPAPVLWLVVLLLSEDGCVEADGLSAAGDCGCAVAGESELGGVVCWAESDEEKLVTSKQTTILAENLIDKCPPVLLHLRSVKETMF